MLYMSVNYGSVTTARSRTGSLPSLKEKDFEVLMINNGCSIEEDHYKWAQHKWWYVWLSEVIEESNKGEQN